MKEIILDNLVIMLVGVFLALLGIIVQKYRAYFLIAGYNTAPREEKKKINIEKVAVALRNSFIVIGLIWIIVPVVCDLLNLGEIKWLFVIVPHIAILIILIVHVNTSEKYKI